VDTCVPGDMVTVSGVVKVTNSDEGTCCVVSRWLLLILSPFLFVNLCIFLVWHLQPDVIFELDIDILGLVEAVDQGLQTSFICSKCPHVCTSSTRSRRHLLDILPHLKYTLA